MKKPERKTYRKELFDFSDVEQCPLDDLIEKLSQIDQKEFDQVIVDWNGWYESSTPVVVGITQEPEERYQERLEAHRQKQVARVHRQREALEKRARELGADPPKKS